VTPFDTENLKEFLTFTRTDGQKVYKNLSQKIYEQDYNLNYRVNLQMQSTENAHVKRHDIFRGRGFGVKEKIRTKESLIDDESLLENFELVKEWIDSELTMTTDVEPVGNTSQKNQKRIAPAGGRLMKRSEDRKKKREDLEKFLESDLPENKIAVKKVDSKSPVVDSKSPVVDSKSPVVDSKSPVVAEKASNSKVVGLGKLEMGISQADLGIVVVVGMGGEFGE
jgi:hypothetical protein